MGRPRINKSTLVVSIDDKLLAWTDGHLGGERDLVRQARLLSEIGALVKIPVLGWTFTADVDTIDNRVGAIAAMMGVNIGRARLLEVDEETLQSLVEGVGSSERSVRA